MSEHSFQPPDQSDTVEISRLQRERDEALAQVALFVKECSCQDWTSERLFSIWVDKAHALLDRLQLAEVVVEAVMAAPTCDTGWRGDDHEPCHQELDTWIAELLKRARAAWREGKA